MNFWVLIPITLFVVLLAGVVLFSWTSWTLYKTTPAALGSAMISASKWLYVGLGLTHVLAVVLSGFVAMNFKKK